VQDYVSLPNIFVRRIFFSLEVCCNSSSLLSHPSGIVSHGDNVRKFESQSNKEWHTHTYITRHLSHQFP